MTVICSTFPPDFLLNKITGKRNIDLKLDETFQIIKERKRCTIHQFCSTIVLHSIDVKGLAYFLIKSQNEYLPDIFTVLLSDHGEKWQL